MLSDNLTMIDTVRALSFVKLLLTVNAINRVAMPPVCSTIDVLHVKMNSPYLFIISHHLDIKLIIVLFMNYNILLSFLFLLLNFTSINESLVVLKHAFDVEILAL